MKIIATSDLHLEKKKNQSAYQLPELVSNYIKTHKEETFVFAIIGDISQNIDLLEEYLQLFKKISIPKFFVSGNHDIWINEETVTGKQSKNSFDIYSTELLNICNNSGFNYLDNKPVIIDNIGFVGNIGWYDYSFRRILEPKVSKKFTFIRKNTFEKVSWNQLTSDDYSNKELWSSDETNSFYRLTAWNDKYFVKWAGAFDDVSFCEHCYKTINNHLKEISNDSKKIVFMSHHAMFEECLFQKKDYAWSFNLAFSGCKYIGDFLISHSKITKIIFGHTHIPGKYRISDKLEAINPCFKPSKPFWVIDI
ncbi:MAG: metallophosphoesterase [Caldisericia bacterium]|nr:metallophosphoesterase [Caldisericia bacterium]